MLKFFQKFSIGKKILGIFSKKVDESAIEELEKLLFEADLGASLVEFLTDKAREFLRKNKTPEALLDYLESELSQKIINKEPISHSSKPHVIFVIGVNGSGKTTSIAKLAHLYKREGKKVIVAACDTFRAAAIEQLEEWSKRVGVDIIKGRAMGDPAATTFDAIQAAIAREVDLVIVDTAGRLHNREDLLGELDKMKRVASKGLPGAPHETFLVLDATIGQNALSQIEAFQKRLPLSGLILTKMDGTAKGGAALAIHQKFKLPITYLGTGEGLEDLIPFDAHTFIREIFS